MVCVVQPSILDQPWGGTFQLPSLEEVAAIPMPGLPNLDPPSARTQFETIAQYLQVSGFRKLLNTSCKLVNAAHVA